MLKKNIISEESVCDDNSNEILNLEIVSMTDIPIEAYDDYEVGDVLINTAEDSKTCIVRAFVNHIGIDKVTESSLALIANNVSKLIKSINKGKSTKITTIVFRCTNDHILNSRAICIDSFSRWIELFTDIKPMIPDYLYEKLSVPASKEIHMKHHCGCGCHSDKKKKDKNKKDKKKKDKKK